jgi:protein-S-isoprenylcysteine O-methyltransferase Ste14
MEHTDHVVDNTDTSTAHKSGLPQWGIAHFILSHSYFMFLCAVVLGLIFDIWIPAQIFSSVVFQYIGVLMLVTGPMLIYWAQHTSSSSKKKMESVTPLGTEKLERDFENGPYRYTRNPTHVGLGIMTLGLAFILNSLFSVIFVLIASVVTKMIFLPKEEAVLEERYGQAYRDYKKKVNTWV